ncbi:MAG: hypothetical protein IT479_12695 [Xanthomonadales bacterium]|nr:hypothetical protein [Xanthomonadales bacterium]MCC6594113.1 hypothetical protein [Xanthomonadales bacterium]MCE7931805.1 hypothetical protein [Xanthomonadales bacterium PRO6]
MSLAETIVGWQCIGCGRVDAPQPCIGVCQDRKVELVQAADYLRLWEQQQEVLARLRRWTHVQPHAGQFESAWQALQAEVRDLLARTDTAD